MVDLAQLAAHSATFSKRAEILLTIDPDTVSRREELGSQLYFSRAPTILASLKQLVENIGSDRVSVVPSSLWREAADYLHSFIGQLRTIQAFDPNGPNPAVERDQLEGQLENIYRDAFGQIALISSATSGISSMKLIDDRLSEIQASWESRMATIDAEHREKSETSAKHLNEMLISYGDQGKAAQMHFKICLKRHETVPLRSFQHMRRSISVWQVEILKIAQRGG